MIGLHEAEAVRRLASGDQSAFDELYQAYAHAAVRTAYLITRSESAAEDAVHEAFVQVLRNIGSLRDGAAFRPWFYRILINAAKRMARTGPAQLVSLDLEKHDQSDPTVPSPDELAVRSDEVDQVRRLIGTLDEAHREPVYLRYFAGLSEQEIAEALDVPPGTVKSRLHNARKMLEKRLERSFGRVPSLVRAQGVSEP